MYQTDPPPSPQEVLPTMYDLKSEDPEEKGLPDQFHLLQLALKIVVMTREQGTLNWELLTGNREEVFGNFTFRYIFRFFSVHLLNIIII
ncbi:hypothetical protein [Dolichospermum flos-aquae]|uniref:Uncharacterized protein n=1 Tax=Dolichospermum flos-aquae LEGE 04289 TaxID=1828708 RepID=A0ACC5Q4B8_DOLFA|nr:hypothetical protein [Dolichospermum flos-aquae]MBE9219885.1 hypothetical protein [Dolichospermum flos-aquae LEGE 04289]